VVSRAVLGAQKKRKVSCTCQQHNRDSSEVQPTAHSSVSQTFLLEDPYWLRKINTDPHISAPVNIQCPDVRYPKLKMLISELFLKLLQIYTSSNNVLRKSTLI